MTDHDYFGRDLSDLLSLFCCVVTFIFMFENSHVIMCGIPNWPSQKNWQHQVIKSWRYQEKYMNKETAVFEQHL